LPFPYPALFPSPPRRAAGDEPGSEERELFVRTASSHVEPGVIVLRGGEVPAGDGGTVDQAAGDVDMLNIERPVEARDDLSAAPIDRTVLGQSVAKAAGPLDARVVGGDDADRVGALGLGEAQLLGVGAEAFALLVVGVEEASEVGVQCRSGVVVHPRIAARLESTRMLAESMGPVLRTAAEDRVGQVVLIALVDPVAVRVGRDRAPRDCVEG